MNSTTPVEAAASVQAHRLLSSSVSGTVFEEILVPYQKPVKRPLVEWAETIEARFQDAKTQAVGDLKSAARVIVNSYNEAALVELLFGRVAQAQMLCVSSLTWLKHHSQRPGMASILQHAFEPYLNLGRLDRINGYPEEALRKFRVIDHAASGNEVLLGDVYVPQDICRDLFASQTILPHLIRTWYILEWVKTLIKCGRYTDVTVLRPHCYDPNDITARDMLAEGSIIALCRLGRYADAIDTTSAGLRHSDGLNRTVFLFRRAEVFAAAGQFDDALRVAEKLVGAFLNYPKDLSLTRLGVLLRLNILMSQLGGKDARALARIGYHHATRIGDILFQSEFLNVMAGLPGAAEEVLRREAVRVKREGWYGLARDEGLRQNNAIDRLSEDLRCFAEDACRV